MEPDFTKLFSGLIAKFGDEIELKLRLTNDEAVKILEYLRAIRLRCSGND